LSSVARAGLHTIFRDAEQRSATSHVRQRDNKTTETVSMDQPVKPAEWRNVMDIQSTETGSHGRYSTIVEGHTGEMTYSRSSPHLIIIDHTAVPDALRGKGVGQTLAAHAIEEARKGGWKIIPLCPFMRAQVQRHPDWQDAIQT
jgi:uncharacterized protein